MPVFGEETFELPIFGGLGITDRPTDTLCPQLTNLLMSAEKEYRIREDFILVQRTTKTPIAIGIAQSIPRTLFENNMEVFTAVGIETADTPTIMQFFDDGTTRDCKWLNCNAITPTSVVQTLPAGYGVKAFCQYKDRYYASNGTTVGKIFRISNFVAAGGALTCTDLNTITKGVDIMLTFRSRVFGIKKNRIYYTDLPAIGLYPEVWNETINFIDIPSVDFDVTVYNAFVYRDKIYMFTDKGIYVLSVNGAPVNWSIQPVSTNFPIYDRDSVCLNKNMIFLTDQQSVTMFDGSAFKPVSNNIRSIFHNNQSSYCWFSLYPWEDGVILTRTSFNAPAGNYTNSVNANSNKKILYFNMLIWAELDFGDSYWATIKAGRSLLPYRGKIASSWLCGVTSATDQSIYFYDSGYWKGDCANSTDHIGGTRSKKPVVLETPAPFLKSRSFKKYKYVDIYGYLNDLNSGSNLRFNNELVTAGDKGKSVFKAPISDILGSQFKGTPTTPLIISGVVDTSLSGLPNDPPFLIIGVDLIYNQDNRGRDGMGM
jgi:hypothetical protein